MSVDAKSNYYDAGGIEVLAVMTAKLTPEQLEGYLLGNCIKYSLRLNFKGTKRRDAEKLACYSRMYSEFLNAGTRVDQQIDYLIAYFKLNETLN